MKNLEREKSKLSAPSDFPASSQ
jgi:hypothetical protein